MPDINELDRRVLSGLDGRDRLRALLRQAGYATLRDFAAAHNRWIQEVTMCLAGSRPYPEIRDELAKALKIKRAQVDALIDEEKAA